MTQQEILAIIHVFSIIVVTAYISCNAFNINKKFTIKDALALLASWVNLAVTITLWFIYVEEHQSLFPLMY